MMCRKILFHVAVANGLPQQDSKGRAPSFYQAVEEPDLAGLRDRALLLTGFVGALRRSELAALDVTDVAEHPSGLVLTLPRSKTNQRGDRSELVVLPRATKTGRCPVTLLKEWTEQAQIFDGPLFRPVSKGNRPLPRRLSEGAINTLIQQAIIRSGLEGDYSAHSLRAGFVTYAHLRGASDRAIAHQTRPPLAGHRGYLHPDPHRLGRQRRHPTRSVASL